jgi:FAD/FMN-containing dehydrogenase
MAMTRPLLAMETFAYGEAGYEQARIGTVANGRVPDRFPDLIARPADDAEVAEAISYAARENLPVGIRSGGHSWSASFLRDGGLLLDLARLNRIEVDATAKVARVQPGALGGDIFPALAAHDLMFPHGHDKTVGIGGFLLQGGFGWNSRKWGLGCQNILAMDVVTANGQLLHIDAENDADLLWAARGAGPGFFAVVTRFYLRLFPMPFSMSSTYIYPGNSLDDVLLWVERVLPDIPSCLELSLFIGKDQPGLPGPTVILRGDALGEDEAESRRVLQLFDTLPDSPPPLVELAAVPARVNVLMDQFHDLLGVGVSRFEVDNMWTAVPVTDLLLGLHAMLDGLPPFPSHLYVLVWGPCRELPDMALSLQAPFWFALHAAGNDPAGDDERVRYVADQLRSMENYSIGMNVGGENLANRQARFMAPDRLTRLEEIRDRYDPNRLFHSYLIPSAH